MTALSRKILDEYQVRKTKKQKTAFIDLMKANFPEITVQEGGFPKCRNLIAGDVEKAKVILTAHYDTCAQLPVPNFITPKNFLFTALYSLLIVLPVVLAIYLVNVLVGMYTVDFTFHYAASLVIYLAFMLVLLAGPANKHTANDNTSGVIVLCELMQTLTPVQKEKVAFVFFDHEETGLLGSSLFHKRFKKIMDDKLLINFDCVSDGDHMMVSATKAARADHGDQLKKAFLPTEEKDILFTRSERTYYPSDQVGFKKAVAVASLKHKRFLGYYMDRIHTSKDTQFDTLNITLLCDSILRFLKSL